MNKVRVCAAARRYWSNGAIFTSSSQQMHKNQFTTRIWQRGIVNSILKCSYYIHQLTLSSSLVSRSGGRLEAVGDSYFAVLRTDEWKHFLISDAVLDKCHFTAKIKQLTNFFTVIGTIATPTKRIKMITAVSIRKSFLFSIIWAIPAAMIRMTEYHRQLRASARQGSKATA